MKISRKLLNFLLLGMMVILFIAGMMWLVVGRISLFDSSSYTSRFALDTALERYQATVLWLDKETDVKQTFTAVYPGLYQVSVFFAGNPQALPQDAAVVFSLKAHCDSPQNIRRVVAPAADIEDDSFYPFTFVPVDDSAGQTYCFVVESLEDLDEQSIGVWAGAYDVYAGGKALYQPPAVEGDQARIPERARIDRPGSSEYTVFLPLIQAEQSESLPLEFDTGFQLHYNGRPIDTVTVFMDRLVSHKSYFWGNKVFYIFLVGFYLVGVFLLALVKSD